MEFGITIRVPMTLPSLAAQWHPVHLVSGATAPISSMSTEAWEQQPCNAFSNAAFFEISLQACKTASDLVWKGMVYIMYISIPVIQYDIQYIYIYRVYMVPSSVSPPPNGLGPQVPPPFPSICKLLAAFLRSSFGFARSLQHF